MIAHLNGCWNKEHLMLQIKGIYYKWSEPQVSKVLKVWKKQGQTDKKEEKTYCIFSLVH